MGVEEVELVFLEGPGHPGQVLHDACPDLLRAHFAAHVPDLGAAGQEMVLLAEEFPDHAAAAVVVHRGIPFRALQVLGAVAPVLGQDVGLRVLLADRAADLGPDLVGQLDLVVPGEDVGHVEAPAVDRIRRLQPFAEDGIPGPPDPVAQGLGGEVQHRQAGDPPPALVGVVGAEEVEAPLRAVGVVIGADLLREPLAVAVEPFVRRAGVIDRNIEDQLHAAGVEVPAQGGQGFVPAEVGIDVEVVDTVVLVDRRTDEDRVQIEGRDAEVLQVRDLLPDALEVAAVEVQAMAFRVFHRGGVPGRHPDRRISVDAVFARPDVVFGVSVAEALREDLVEDGLLHPGGLDVVRQQDEVAAHIRQPGRDPLLRIEIDAAVGDEVELVLHPALGHFQLRLPPDEAAIGFDGLRREHDVGPVGVRAEDDGLHRGVGVEADADADGLPEGRGGIGDKIGSAVGIDALEPLRPAVRERSMLIHIGSFFPLFLKYIRISTFVNTRQVGGKAEKTLYNPGIFLYNRLEILKNGEPSYGNDCI